MKEQQRTESLNFQFEMYSWLLKRKMQGKFTTDLQDIEKTNAILLKSGFPDAYFAPEEMCSLLGVDAIITSNYSLSKPISTGGAIALTILVGLYAPTNSVKINLKLNTCSENKMIWTYDHKYSGGIGTTPAILVDGLMRNASKKFPYNPQY